MTGESISKAAAFLTKGGLVAIPTETVYGLAANALDERAVAGIFEAKERPTFDPLIIHTDSIEKIHYFASEIPEKLALLLKNFSPGPLTVLLPKKAIIPDLVTSGLSRVAVRIPNHPVALSLLSKLDFPLAAPSANPFGYVSPTTAQHVEAQLGDKIDYILDGGACQIGLESTIVGMENNEVIVYRKGGLTIEEIESVVGAVLVNEHSESNPAAPGMLQSHYSPAKRLQLVTADSDFENAGWLGFSQKYPQIRTENQFLLSPSADLKEAAQRLFAGLRYLDNQQVNVIYTELLPEIGLGRAINDRLRRALVKD